jgi:UDP-N-acetylmuramoyl-L-alanyl-D-glutamate--2,6-diaminopimelate ligase
VFTNLTQDHLDYHGTMQAYFAAKKKLFDGLAPDAVAITNADDPHGNDMVEGIRARVLRYSVGQQADIFTRELSMSVSGMELSVAAGTTVVPVHTHLTGRFNVSNILAAFGAAIGVGLAPAVVARGIGNVKEVRGRFEQIVSPRGWTAIVDYAHTPDALENALTTVRQILGAGHTGRIITVFGCGGDRDRTKRPQMGAIASTLSDVTIVTSDNPRTEDPLAIIRDICSGIRPGAHFYTEPDRRAAIAQALAMAVGGDVVVVAGKGHENYQVIGTVKSHLDDREEVEAFMRTQQ